jgi:arginase family enzyme
MEEGLTDRLVQVGIRTMTGHQREQARKFGVEVIEMKDWRDGRDLGLQGPVYISFDLDALEPGMMPGLAHREPGGFTVRQALSIIHGVGAPLVGADIVELNPSNDPTGISAAVAAKLARELAGQMLRNDLA